MLRHRSLWLALPGLALALLAAGCGNKVIGIPPEPPPPTAPAASTDVAAIRRLAWAWNARDTSAIEDLFTADYVYAFIRQGSDSVITGPWLREEELRSSHHLFIDGTPTEPPATVITFLIDPTLIPEPDSRVGKNGKWHREIYTSISAGIRTDAGFYTITGHARFFAVRGDSAKIPQFLKDRGYLADSTRWWIDGWEDGTGPGLPPYAAHSELTTSIGHVKALYLPLPPALARARF